ncbi:hypothetical protein E4U42_005773 [Claviceps africana]|uniref:Uncharacterized protein n=1 Tax=Claviceps africana TaxID=83212 RepID=A0A8K0NH75_9HYPO|nr:hypothetical protein E4U42_005773 [Claviceps africana]
MLDDAIPSPALSPVDGADGATSQENVVLPARHAQFSSAVWIRARSSRRFTTLHDASRIYIPPMEPQAQM